jgi:hypothetical protein
MKSNFLRCVMLFLILAVPATVRGQFSFSTNNGTLTITAYSGSGGAVAIPSTTNGYPVTALGEGAFYENATLTSVSIPNSVTSIGGLAFYWCNGLTNIDIPNSVTNIGVQTFGLCSGLTSVTIPNSVTSIGTYCFAECTSLTNITIPYSLTSIGDAAFAYDPNLVTISVDPLNPVYTNIDGVLFDAAQSLLIAYPANKPGTSYTVPNNVTRIGNFAFQYCYFLTNIIIPAGVTNIGGSAFAYDQSLAAITVDESNSFYSSGEGVLFDKGKTSLIQCPQTKAGNYSIPNTVTSVSNGAFYGCSTLANVVLPSGINSLGLQVFESCSNLTSITIPSGVSNIGSYCFQYCTGLTNVTIPDGVTNIGAYAFNVCNLHTVTFPSSVNYIGSWAFYGCTTLKTVYFQGNAPAIGGSGPLFSTGSNQAIIYYLYGTTGWSSTFANLRAYLWNPLSQLAYTVSSGTITITGYTGPGGAVTIPSRINGLPVTAVGSGTFYYLPSLLSITISASVTNIGPHAFSGCSGLRSVYFNGNAPVVGLNAFSGATNATIYYMQGSTGWHSPFGGLPAVLWNPEIQLTDGNLGVGVNGFGFNVMGTANIPIVFEASTSLPNTGWTALQTCTLTNGSIYFSDPQWTNYPSRFYRIRSP